MSQSPSVPDVPALSRIEAAGPPRMKGWILLVIALVAAAVYANSLRNGFAFDDSGIVKDNPHVVDLQWTTIWTDNYWPTNEGSQPDALYRPLTLWTYLANQCIAPGVAWTFHLVNVLLHALVSVLVAMLAWRLLGDRLVALVAGLIFAVHPLHTEVVANTVGRAELLAAAWTLLALLIYLPNIPLMRESAPERRPIWHGLLVSVCFFAAILSKETPVTLLLAIPFIDFWRWIQWRYKQLSLNSPSDAMATPLRGIASLIQTAGDLSKWLVSQSFRYYLPMVLFFAIYLVMRINACGLMTDTGAIHPVVNILTKANPVERIITPFGLLARYLGLTFYPMHLSADYSAPSIPLAFTPLSDNALPLVGMLTCLLVAIIAWINRRKIPELMLIVGLFITSYVLVANFLRIGTIFGERLFYWPSAFVILLIAWAAVRLYQQALLHKAFIARCVAAILFLAGLGAMSYRTYVRNTDWQDNIPLAIATGRDNPGSAKACFWAGSILVWADRPEYSDIGKMLLARAVELYPKFSAAHWEIAKYYGREGKLAESLVHLVHAVRLDPGTHTARIAMGGILQDLRRTDPKEYMPILEKNLSENPDDETAHLAMAMAWHAQSKWDEAEAEAAKAIEMASVTAPDKRDQFHEAAAELATIRFDRGNINAGISLFREYVIHVRTSVDARCDMAKMLISLPRKDYPNALAEANMNLERARKVNPQSPRVREVQALVNRKSRESEPDATASAIPHQVEFGSSPETSQSDSKSTKTTGGGL